MFWEIYSVLFNFSSPKKLIALVTFNTQVGAELGNTTFKSVSY